MADRPGGNLPSAMRRNGALYLLIAVAVIMLGAQSWVSVRNSRRVEALVSGLTAADTMPGAKTREEVLALRIQNELRRSFAGDLAASLFPTIAALVALVGAWVGYRGYLSTRENDRRDRDKERLDRAATDLKDALDNLVGPEPRQRAVGAIGLLHFLTADKADYHFRALTALLTAARVENDAEVLRNIRIAVDRAVSVLPEEALTQASWQGVKLSGATFAGRSLRNLDLRDAVIEDGDLAGCDLSEANLSAARLNGANLGNARLDRARLVYADLAGATLAGATLAGADIHEVKVSALDLGHADLRGAVMDPDAIPWDKAKNWRSATFDAGVRERLIARYGPEAKGVRVLMLMWEIAPLVAGGSWTASYHLVRQLRRAGADVTVVVPWDEASVATAPFGSEVEVIALGIEPPEAGSSGYRSGNAAPPGAGFGDYWSAYGRAPEGLGDSWSPYGRVSPSGGWNPYSSPAFAWSPYGSPSPFSLWAGYGRASAGYTAYAPWNPYQAATKGEGTTAVQAGSTMLWLIDEFRRRLVRRAATEGFDVIHAHDWVTFPAAEALAKAKSLPWVAHFHSTERDRRPDDGDPVVSRIEREACASAAHLVVPSEATKRKVRKAYAVDDERVTVAPNVLSEDSAPMRQRGSFETKRVIFVGRLTPQKGPDRFAAVATAVRRTRSDVSFWMFGAGEMARQLGPDVEIRGPIAWEQRAWAYDKATVLIVPSRSEPFGMVVLEAMQCGVPVLYPADSGAAEVLGAGVKITADDTETMVEAVQRLVEEWEWWTAVVAKQIEEVRGYAARKYEERVREVWEQVRVARQR